MVVLREDGRYGDNTNPTLAAAELATERYLKQVWPRLITAARTGNPAPNSRVPFPNTNWTDWNGDTTYQQGDPGVYILQGDQCLVFFLGGMQVPNGSGFSCMGFGTRKDNPTIISGATDAPYFEFPSDRLRRLGQTQTRSGYFASFLDPYDIPYLYFCNRGGPGGALNVYNSPLNSAAQQFILPGATLASDCPDFGVSPYFEPSTRAYAKDGFQIISAGYDQTFGPGGIYDGGQAWVMYPLINGSTVQLMPNQSATPPHGAYDDLTNFHDKILGSGNQ
jgi:hypothetical protein